MPERTAVYRLYDDAGVLLYVGVTKDPDTRCKWHVARQPWGAEIARHEVIWLDDRVEAHRLETAVIASANPLHNVIRVPVDRETYFRNGGRGGRPATGQTPQRNIRVSDDIWSAALQRAKSQETTLTGVICSFLEWYVSVPPNTPCDEYKQRLRWDPQRGLVAVHSPRKPKVRDID